MKSIVFPKETLGLLAVDKPRFRTISPLASKFGSRRLPLSRLITKLRAANPYFGSFLAAAISIVFAIILPSETGRWSASAIFLIAVLVSASLWGLRYGLISTLVTALAYDIFFIPPLYQFDIDNWQNALSLLIFAVTGAAVSALAETLNRKARASRRSEILAKRLYALSRRLGEVDDIEEIALRAAVSIGVAVGAKAILLLPVGTAFKVAATHPRFALLNETELSAIQHACGHSLRKIGDPVNDAGLTCTLLPIGAMPEDAAILAVCPTRRRFWRLPDRMRVIDMMASQALAAIKRVQSSQQAEEARIAAETEKFRSALLTSISHDLKTPLAIMLGSASSLRHLGRALTEEQAETLLSSIVEEGERLEQFIANLLDMSRIESDAVRPKNEPAEIGDLIGSAMHRAQRVLSNHRVKLEIPDIVPDIEVDPVLMERVIYNILENAANYSPNGSLITLRVREGADGMAVQVLDEGPGIPPAALAHLFNKFYRVETGGWKPRGTGLGLAISRGFLQAMGGSIEAANRVGTRGAIFTIKVPAKALKGAPVPS
jgi:two-component system, OmpR family, sensor histidine kinase KdpD